MSIEHEIIFRTLVKQAAIESLKNKKLTKNAFFAPVLAALVPLIKFIGVQAAIVGSFVGIGELIHNWKYIQSKLTGKGLEGLLPDEKRIAQAFVARGYSPLYAAELAKTQKALQEGIFSEDAIKALKELSAPERSNLFQSMAERRRAVQEFLTLPQYFKQMEEQAGQVMQANDMIQQALANINRRLAQVETQQFRLPAKTIAPEDLFW